MKPYELRIGNIVSFGKEQEPIILSSIGMERVTALYPSITEPTEDDFLSIPLDQLEKIVLNEEWLVMLGFKWNNKANEYQYPKTLLHICFYKTDDLIECYIESVGIDIDYVHELQNLLFSLKQIEK